MDRFHGWIAAAAVVAVAAGSDLTLAQTARSGGGANVQLLEQLQQLASERTSLQAENERLKNELADVKKNRDALKATQQALDRRATETAAALAHSSAERESSEQELTQTKAKMQELIAKFRETIQKLREVETEDATTKQTLATRDRELSVCVDHNVALYRLDEEVLTRLEKEGFWSRLAEAEPFTRIKRVQLENFVDEHRAAAEDQRAAHPKPATPPQSPAPRPDASPPATTPAAVPPAGH